jgi:hypothetical protein
MSIVFFRKKSSIQIGTGSENNEPDDNDLNELHFRGRVEGGGYGGIFTDSLCYG